MKLTQWKLIETIRKKNQGWTTYQSRKIAGISIRRVNQIWKDYQISEEIPEIGRKNGIKKPVFGFKNSFLSLGIGIINLLPLGPIDGGSMMKIVLDQNVSDKKKALVVFGRVTLLCIALLLLNLFYTGLKYLFTSLLYGFVR